MSDTTFIGLNEANRLLLEMEKSDWWDVALKSVSPDSPEFRQGAFWGAATALVYINAYANKFYPTVVPDRDKDTGEG